MSSKSRKRPNADLTMTKALNNALVIFLWAYCNVTEPTENALAVVRDEIYSVCDSIVSGALTIPQLRKALKDDYDLEVR